MRGPAINNSVNDTLRKRKVVKFISQVGVGYIRLTQIRNINVKVIFPSPNNRAARTKVVNINSQIREKNF